MQREYYVYIATNQRNTVFYTGVTNDPERRMLEHKSKITKGFTARYNIDKLVYYQEFPTAEEAIAEEKRIKGGSRKKKKLLIESINPRYEDLMG